jgi:hypothetical protein
MKIKKHIAISDSGVIFNGATGDSYSMNPIALEILNLIKADLPEDQIKSKVLDKFDVDPDRLDGDLYDFYAHLRQLNLLESEN